MKKFIGIAFFLLIIHTVEEAVFRLWATDPITLLVSNFVNIQPIWVYWIGQIILYIFLLYLLLADNARRLRWTLVLLGIILLLEFVHPFVAFQSQHYEAGLYSGTILGLYGFLYWKQLLKYSNSN